MFSRLHGVLIKRLLILCTPATVAWWLACAPRHTGVIGADSPVLHSQVEIALLHTNDIHGKFRAVAAPAAHDSVVDAIGGFANLSAHVNHERARGGRILLLDAGDVMTGNPICEYEHASVRGGALIHFMNRVGYDAMTLGHHEFDLGPRNLDGLLELAQFPVLSANTRRANGELVTSEAFHIFDVDGLRVGIIGLMTEQLNEIVARSSLGGVRVIPAAAIAREIVREIDPQTDLIVLLTHIGLEGDRALARQVAGIDIIVGGHSHSRLAKPLLENGVIIVQAGSDNLELGRLRLTVANDRVTAHAGELVELRPLAGCDPELAQAIRESSLRIDRDYGRVIGHLAAAWQGSRDAESNVGNWICDRLREHTGADFAVYNSGGIRKDLVVGPLKRLDIFELLPFENRVATFQCSGQELLLLLETNAQAAQSAEHSILQVSGVRYSYAASDASARIAAATVGGRPINRLATYTGATVDYVLFSKPARYFGFDPDKKDLSERLLSNLIVQAVERSPNPIDARIDGRIRAVSSISAATEK